MASLPPRKPRVKSRTCRLYPGSPMLLSITEKGRTDDYFVRGIPSDWGRAFALSQRPPAGETPEGLPVYQVCLDGPADSVCCCKGFTRWGHCRHVESLTALGNAGRLPAA